MALFNFQKPDKVIMIDSDDFNGKFEFRPLEPGLWLNSWKCVKKSNVIISRRICNNIC